MKAAEVLALRIATQRLVGTPHADPTSVVRHLLAVQAQDAPLARASVGLRCGGVADDVRAALDSGALIRTHVLRPTWHLVAAEDLRWLLDLTAPKMLSGMAARHRDLGLEPEVVHGALDTFATALAGGAATRPQLQAALRRDGVLGECSMLGQQVGHLLLQAEALGLVVSGPVADGGLGVHTYALADHRLPPAPARTREEAVAELVGRFVASHGPVSTADLQRWAPLTRREIDAALAHGGLATTTVDGVDLHYHPDAADAAAPHLADARRGTFVLPVFDEVYLSYHGVEFPRRDGHPLGLEPNRFAQSGGGVVLHRLTDVGTWSRTHTPKRFDVTLILARDTTPAERAASERAARRLAAASAPGTPVTVSPA